MTTITERTQLHLHAMRELVETPGPWASVYVGLADRDADGRMLERAARWHGLATLLLGEGAPDELVARVGAEVHTEPPGRGVLAAFGSADGSTVLFRMPGVPEPETAAYGPLPRVVPLLRWLQYHPPHLLVETDRTGADVEAVVDGERWRWTVEGPDDEIERNAPGGWSQHRYQRRAEDSWLHNAGRVADSVATAVRGTGARLVIVNGDIRAVQLLEEQLPAWVRTKTTWRHISGARSADGSERDRPARVEAALAEFVDGESVVLADRFAQERAPGGTAVEGVAETFAALARGEVATLLLVPETLPDRSAWFGSRPAQVLPEADELPPADWGPALRGPMVDVAVRAALGTRAQIRLVPAVLPGSPAEGIGALCRFR